MSAWLVRLVYIYFCTRLYRYQWSLTSNMSCCFRSHSEMITIFLSFIFFNFCGHSRQCSRHVSSNLMCQWLNKTAESWSEFIALSVHSWTLTLRKQQIPTTCYLFVFASRNRSRYQNITRREHWLRCANRWNVSLFKTEQSEDVLHQQSRTEGERDQSTFFSDRRPPRNDGEVSGSVNLQRCSCQDRAEFNFWAWCT